MRKKILIFLLSVSLLTPVYLLITPKPAYAITLNPWTIVKNLKSDVNTFVGKTIWMAIFDSVPYWLAGCDAGDIITKKCEMKDPLEKAGYLPGGGLAYTLKAMDEARNVDNIPINLAVYSQDLASRLPFGIVESPKAYAIFNPLSEAEIANAKLMSYFFENTVLDIWKITRNIAYSIIVMILVVVGFMIMFRKKINPQLTVSVANALPRLVLGVILITFSYPIAALTIPAIGAMNSMVDKLFESIVVHEIEAEGLMAVLSGLMTSFATLFTPGVNLFAGVIVVALILAFFLATFTVLYTLISRFVSIITATVFGPLILALGIIPGQESLTSDWLKGLMINAISIPAVFAVFYMGLAFFLPVKAGDPVEAVFNTLIGNYVRWGLGIGIMLQARKAPAAIAAALKAPAAWVPGVSPKGKR